MRIPSVGILEQPSASPVPASQTWAAPTGVQSSFGATGNFYFNPNYATGDVTDSFIDIPDVQTIPTATPYIIPPGWGIWYSGTAAGSYQMQQTTVGNWVTLGAAFTAGSGPFGFMSDGVNFRILTTTQGTVTFIRFR